MDLGEDDFQEECAKMEFAIKEAACESPNYGNLIYTLLKYGTCTESLK